MAVTGSPKATRRFNRLPRVAAAVERRVSQINRVAATNIQERSKQSFEGEKHGEVYRVPGLRSRRFHVASAPGEAPAIVFGTLAGSLGQTHPSSFLSFVYSTDEKAPYLEFGTRFMEPRPFFAPAAREEETAYTRAMTKAIEVGVREGSR